MKRKYGKILLIFVTVFMSLALTGCAKLIKSGKYVSTDTGKYKDAYVIMKNDCIQFYNIDLNEIYQEAARFTATMFHEELTDEELDEYTDMNKYLVENPVKIEKEDESGMRENAVCYILKINDKCDRTPIIGYIEEEGKILLLFQKISETSSYPGVIFVKE